MFLHRVMSVGECLESAIKKKRKSVGEFFFHGWIYIYRFDDWSFLSIMNPENLTRDLFSQFCRTLDIFDEPKFNELNKPLVSFKGSLQSVKKNVSTVPTQ